jgi:hypothetical protein
MQAKQVFHSNAHNALSDQNAVGDALQAVLARDIAVQRDEPSPVDAPSLDVSGLDSKEVVERWRGRRRQSAEALASFGLQAMHARSPVQMASVWMTWSLGVVDRMVADANDNLALRTLVTQKLATNTFAVAKCWSDHAGNVTGRSSGGTETVP